MNYKNWTIGLTAVTFLHVITALLVGVQLIVQYYIPLHLIAGYLAISYKTGEKILNQMEDDTNETRNRMEVSHTGR